MPTPKNREAKSIGGPILEGEGERVEMGQVYFVDISIAFQLRVLIKLDK
jgi:hypothetical protein